MKNILQRPPVEPDMALMFLSFLFNELHKEPERNCAMLDGLAWQILDKGPKTPFGLALTAHAERWLRRYLWMRDIDSLSPSDQAARLVIDSAMRLAAPPGGPFQPHDPKRLEKAFQQNTTSCRKQRL